MCQSWFGTTSLAGKEMSSSKKNSPGSDIFHIYPASYGMNSRRGNRPYGEVLTAANVSGNGTKYGTPVQNLSITNCVAGAYIEGSITLSTNVLEPADEYKGDIARSYFGTMVKWAGEWAFNKNENGCVIFDATIDADTHYGPENNYGFTDYGLALMLKWHRQDPVSQKRWIAIMVSRRPKVTAILSSTILTSQSSLGAKCLDKYWILINCFVLQTNFSN
jgi:endonuclease I